MMKHLPISLFALLLMVACSSQDNAVTKIPERPVLSKTELLNKIKGGWAGQVIGCTFGGPTEFVYPGTMIQDYQPIRWDSTRIAYYFDRAPGLYDDVYMDLTFVEVMNKEGIDAPASSHAMAFAHATYPLWHANQAARYNILNGIMPPESGFWKNNPHSEDIDFQIEADFAGLMSPGMPNASSEICDRVGHLMNYGDGWYGGVYLAAMYSLAFVSQDIEFIVKEGLKTIPVESTFNKCIQDVIDAYRKNPMDWKAAWFTVEKNWAGDIACPDGIFKPFNIDARVNSAYVVIGLLYGRGDFTKTLEIATRCGQDSDCNPASAGGILGTMIGYDKIPESWSVALKPIGNRTFPYTNLSLENVYESSLKQAIDMVIKHGGSVDGENVTLLYQIPEPVRLEQGFSGLYPMERRRINTDLENTAEIRFEGTGFSLTGEAIRAASAPDDSGVIHVEMIIDGQQPERFSMPLNDLSRRLDIAWKYGLDNTSHTLRFKILNPWEAGHIRIWDLIVYGPKPFSPGI
jgi:hypothetical protein